MNFFTFLAEETREHLAQLGFKTLDEAVGRADLLVRKQLPDYPKTEKIDLSRITFMPKEAAVNALRKTSYHYH